MFKVLTLQIFMSMGVALLAIPSQAQIKVGVTVSATGPAASLGIPEKNVIPLLPRTIAGQSVEYIVLDDASDPTAAVKNTRRFVAEERVDVVVGSSITPNSLAMIDVVAEGETPMISLASSIRIVEPIDAKRYWVFKVVHNDSLQITSMSSHMANAGVRKVGVIGMGDAYGEGVMAEFLKIAPARRLAVVAQERYSRGDTGVVSQVLKILASNPDAVFIAASGTPAAMPAKTLRERGYKGKIYFTDGVVNDDFLRVGGKDVEGAFLPSGLFVVADQLPDQNPVRKVAADFAKKHDAVYPKGSANHFSAHTWTIGLLLEKAVPAALASAKPGTREFRRALRNALETVNELPTAQGFMSMSKSDHMGYDQRASAMVTIAGGKWKLAK